MTNIKTKKFKLSIQISSANKVKISSVTIAYFGISYLKTHDNVPQIKMAFPCTALVYCQMGPILLTIYTCLKLLLQNSFQVISDSL